MPPTSTSLPERPLPEPTADSQPYWDGLREHELRIQRCARCGTLRHYPRPLCAACCSFEVNWVLASGRGRIHSWTVAHHPFHLAFKAEAPYIVLTVDLDEGVRLAAPLRGADAGVLAIGRAVEIVYEDVSPTLTLPACRLAE